MVYNMKKVEKDYIGIIDTGFEGMALLEGISARFPNENLLYVNDPKHAPYSERGSEEIIELISKSYEKIKDYKLKMIVVLSDTICEYALDYIESMELPVSNIVSNVIKAINKKHPKKNVIYASKKSFMEANIVQKDISYNRLYTIEADKLIEVAENRNVKTGETFTLVSSLVKGLGTKDIELIVTTSGLVSLYNTEFKEYLKECEMIDLLGIMVEDIDKKLKVRNEETKGSISIILPSVDKDYVKSFKNKCDRFVKKAKYL